MFRSNVSSKFLYFVGKVFDENTGKVSTRVNGWQLKRVEGKSINVVILSEIKSDFISCNFHSNNNN